MARPLGAPCAGGVTLPGASSVSALRSDAGNARGERLTATMTPPGGGGSTEVAARRNPRARHVALSCGSG